MVEVEWAKFKKYYPHADFSKFHAYPMGINFEFNDMGIDVFKGEIGGPVHHYDGPVGIAMLKALGERLDDNPWPKRFRFTKDAPQMKGRWHIPSEIDMGGWVAKFQDVFQKQTIKFTTSKEAHIWLRAPNMKYWDQQLNFALWCSTYGCGISKSMLSSLLHFHILYTVRRILYQMKCPLPQDQYFNEKKNNIDTAAYERISKEFNAPSDLRFKEGGNKGLGDVWIYVPYSGHIKAKTYHPRTYDPKYPGGYYDFPEVLGTSGVEDKIDWIVNDEAEKQWE